MTVKMFPSMNKYIQNTLWKINRFYSWIFISMKIIYIVCWLWYTSHAQLIYNILQAFFSPFYVLLWISKGFIEMIPVDLFKRNVGCPAPTRQCHLANNFYNFYIWSMRFHVADSPATVLHEFMLQYSHLN